MSRSIELKEEGNRHFQAGDYVGAESLYSKAIIADPKNPALYTNRAMARLKLAYWDSVITDCEAVLDLPSGATNIKAHYYLSQAQLALGSPAAALPHALKAHALCAASHDKSLAAVTAVVLRCKKEKWEQEDRLRVREEQALEREMVDLLKREVDAEVAAEQDEMEKSALREEGVAKIARLETMFERARTKAEQRREVPDWLIDDISFGVMVDPVITKTGKSYERASITEHLRRHPSDPLTREPLTLADLRPNMALRDACEEFLEENGWAVDW